MAERKPSQPTLDDLFSAGRMSGQKKAGPAGGLRSSSTMDDPLAEARRPRSAAPAPALRSTMADPLAEARQVRAAPAAEPGRSSMEDPLAVAARAFEPVGGPSASTMADPLAEAARAQLRTGEVASTMADPLAEAARAQVRTGEVASTMEDPLQRPALSEPPAPPQVQAFDPIRSERAGRMRRAGSTGSMQELEPAPRVNGKGGSSLDDLV